MVFRWLVVVLCVGFLGCGVSAKYGFDAATPTSVASSESNQIGVSEGANDVISRAKGDRKIIYSAEVELIVEDLKQTEAAVSKLIEENDGYLSHFREDRTYRERLRAYWTIRIPVERFNQFLTAATALGIPVDKQITAEDVTEEYVDLDRRLANKQRLETRILQLLDDHTGEIKDVIEVESQLARVREEIERMEGRRRYLADHIAMTTVEITAREGDPFMPRQLTFAGRLSETFTDSMRALVMMAQGLIIFAVAAVPWILVFCLVAATPIVWFRRRRRAVRGLE